MSRRYASVCVDCGGNKADLHPLRQRCIPCDGNFSRQMLRANAVIGREVARGRLQPARTLQCVDCGRQALDWDHRDYSKPLEVEPTCRACNQKRGPAKYVIEAKAAA